MQLQAISKCSVWQTPFLYYNIFYLSECGVVQGSIKVGVLDIEHSPKGEESLHMADLLFDEVWI